MTLYQANKNFTELSVKAKLENPIWYKEVKEYVATFTDADLRVIRAIAQDLHQIFKAVDKHDDNYYVIINKWSNANNDSWLFLGQDNWARRATPEPYAWTDEELSQLRSYMPSDIVKVPIDVFYPLAFEAADEVQKELAS
jgi:hypothetical protein